MQRGLSDWRDFPLPAFVADQQHTQFTGLLIHLRHQPQLIRSAPKTFFVELSKRTVCWRLGQLIIFPAHEISRGIHPGRLLHALGQRLSTRNIS
jgi:hypothetical protein